MKLTITTMTPLHIGSGEKYSAAEFLIKGNDLHRVDIGKVFMNLDEKRKEDLIIRLEDRNFMLGSFLKDIPIPGIKRYSSKLKTGMPNEINEHVKTNGGVFIPGSSIKGSIRTSILYNLVDEKSIHKIGRIFDSKRYWQRDWDVQNLIDRFFAGDARCSSSNSSFLRFLQVTDTNPINNMSIYSIKALKGGRNGWTWYKRYGRDVTLFSETIDAGKNLNSEITVDYKPDVYKDLKLGEKERLIDIDKIKEFIYNFSADLIEYEINFAERYDIDFLKSFYRRIESENEEDSPLLKLGHGSGFLATTIGLKLKKYPNIFNKVRTSLRGKSYPYEFPKTRKIVVEEKTPPGWIKLRTKP